MSKRELILASLQEGPKTSEELQAVASVDSKGLASQFTYLRMMGHYPMKNAEGKIHLGSKEDFEASKANRSSSSGTKAAKTPSEALVAARKREGRAQSALDNAKKKHEADKKDKLNKLYFERATADAAIAALLVHQAEEACKAAGIDPHSIVDAPAGASEATEVTEAPSADTDDIDPLV